jgi:hypothetical protein
MPLNAQQYLQMHNPRLLELRRRYRSVTSLSTDHSLWSEDYVKRDVDLRYFRGDNAYVWQMRENVEMNYLLTSRYVAMIDRLQLMQSLEEDGLFGAMTYTTESDHIVSRDLLDSVVEIYFLEDFLHVSRRKQINILDIGAGYGRLAHRIATALPRTASLYCVDAVPESTFLCEFYLGFRRVCDRAQIVLLDEVRAIAANIRFDLAVNICSFSECTLETITGWLDLLRRGGVRFLMIVPSALENSGMQLMSLEKDGRRIDYLPEIQRRDYKLIARRPKYLNPIVQMYGVSPTHHYLFQLTS